MEKILVDYHFHPNLSKIDSKAKIKCKKIWQKFADNKLDVVVITEHVFKNPPRAFKLMKETRPADVKTIIFPGVEALTKEGADLIVFAEDERIYKHQKIMVPRQLDVFEMIDYINDNSGLYGSIAHPFNIGNSQLGVKASMEAIAKLKGVEAHNTCFRGAMKFTDLTGLSKLFPIKRKHMNWVRDLPKNFFNPKDMNLITGGSDAHVLEEIGTGLLVPFSGKRNQTEIFKTISTNKSEKIIESKERIHFWLGIYKVYNVVVEGLTKAFRLYEGKIYQHDDQFSNFYSEAEKEAVLALRKQRGKLLKPILSFLTYFDFTPTTLSGISVISLLASFALVTMNPVIGISLFVAYICSVILTGALSQYQQKQSEAGAITKISISYLAVFVPILTVIWFELADPFWSASYLGLYTGMIWLIIRLNQIGQPIRFILRSKFIVITAIFIFVMNGWNILDELLITFSLYMTVMNIWMLYKIRRFYKT